MPIVTQPSCAFNVGVLCEKRKCWLCGWCPAIEKTRKEMIRDTMPEVIKFKTRGERWLIGKGEYPEGWKMKRA